MKKLLCLGVVVLVCFSGLVVSTESDGVAVEQLVLDILKNDTSISSIKNENERLSIYAKDYFFGVHPELYSHERHDEIHEYLKSIMIEVADPQGLENEYNDYVNEGSVGCDDELYIIQSYYSRPNAILYAYNWTENGKKKRNSAYPDLGADCTNFVSQVTEAGGIPQYGTPTGCCHTVTTSEWWCQPRSLCFHFRRHRWTTSWSVVSSYRNYHCMQWYATSINYSESQVSSLVSRAQPGDMLQLHRDGVWFHSTVISNKRSNLGELYLTFQSGLGGRDEVDLPLSQLISRNQGGPYTFRLIAFP